MLCNQKEKKRKNNEINEKKSGLYIEKITKFSISGRILE